MPDAVWRVESAAYHVERPGGSRATELGKPVLRMYVAPSADSYRSASGVASIAFEIGPDGVPMDPHPFDPLHDRPVNVAIDSAAVESVRAWRFDLATLDRKAALSKATVELACGDPQAVVSPATYRVGNGVSKPEMAFKVEPEYSEAARKAKLLGVVVLYIVIDRTGHPVNIAVLKSLGKGLDEKAIEAVLQWRFHPGARNGVPVNVAATIEVNFRLL